MSYGRSISLLLHAKNMENWNGSLMKKYSHAIAGVIGFICIVAFVASTAYAALFGEQAAYAAVKSHIFTWVFVLIAALLVAGGTGVNLLGKRQEVLALTKQKRGPIGFMTSLLILLPCAYFLSKWAVADSFGPLFYVVQTVELLASGVVIAMVGLNIRDGMALTGRIARKAAAPGSKSPSIDQRDGGPLVAMAVPVLTDENGEALQTKPVMALCRCGASKNKPFCDGSHNAIKFDSAPSEDRTKDEVLTYEGKDITVHYNRLLCSHAAECGRLKKAAFDSSRKPWIKPDNATPEEIKDIVKACPSGALRFSVNGEEPQKAGADFVGITAEKDGPYRVAGIPLLSPSLAEGAHGETYVLCRCGASKNKPYCDGSHFDIGWTSAD
jgi:CDGSH-type Zn-finger protein